MVMQLSIKGQREAFSVSLFVCLFVCFLSDDWPNMKCHYIPDLVYSRVPTGLATVAWSTISLGQKVEIEKKEKK